MKKMKMMANVAKFLMLAALMAVGTQTVNAQEEVSEFKPIEANNWWMGEDVTNITEAYLYNVGAGIFATGSEPTEKDINNADLWTIESGYTFTNKRSSEVIYLSGTNAKITATSWTTKASKFTLEEGETKDRGIANRLAVTTFIVGTRYFNIDNDSYKYTAAHSKGPWNDWLLISSNQKEAYVEYVDSFYKLKTYYTNAEVVKNEALLEEVQTTLTTTSSEGHSYSTYKEDKALLAQTIKDVEDYLNKIATGIKNIESAKGNAEVIAIYGVNGEQRNNITKGINIVKLSNGKTQKVLVK